MTYAVKWYDSVTGEEVVQTGDSIPEAIEKARAWYGAGFTFGEGTVYGIINKYNEFVPVAALEEPGRYSKEDLDRILEWYYAFSRSGS